MNPSLYAYGNLFYAYQQQGSLASARRIVPMLARALRPHSVLDVGCGAGAWCRAWMETEGRDVTGIDGGYVRPEQLLFDPRAFQQADVGEPFDLGRRFDLVQCLEVAEHLDPERGQVLVRNLAAHGPVVLFSAAPPGQGGEHHVNERPYGYWRDAFLQHGFGLYDWLRPRLASRPGIEPWYRYNILLFVHEQAADSLPADVRVTRVPDTAPVRDVAPLAWRLRKRLLAPLPPSVVTGLAHLRHRYALGMHRPAAGA